MKPKEIRDMIKWTDVVNSGIQVEKLYAEAERKLFKLYSKPIWWSTEKTLSKWCPL